MLELRSKYGTILFTAKQYNQRMETLWDDVMPMVTAAIDMITTIRIREDRGLVWGRGQSTAESLIPPSS